MEKDKPYILITFDKGVFGQTIHNLDNVEILGLLEMAKINAQHRALMDIKESENKSKFSNTEYAA